MAKREHSTCENAKFGNLEGLEAIVQKTAGSDAEKRWVEPFGTEDLKLGDEEVIRKYSTEFWIG